ncbi:alpha/beta hydrolase [Mycolicibacterium sp. 018/SC-01/001]|uniref:alpha/beta fold hydrolase n=1 Tax=Mycolicibacterium sp. 018/SC-01/001 TaxID=2592069 RepID=UPI00117C3E27|nr:alpha/beta hydrolase [Mycolicibacterium sp. 018/SC-01/001]TRW82084.1 alpha/beta hydrolase [Mycolicibacterium sp. 018/SC-01/001]
MTVVFVHGNPETEHVWDLLAMELAQLGYEDQVRLSPPGFGAAVPGGFDHTPEAYRRWLVGELEEFPEPVDLVGHDLGGGHTVAVAMTRPDLLRSWASDVLGLFDPAYVWHDLALIWQQQPAGEDWVDAQLRRTSAERADQLAARGVEPGIAGVLGAAYDRVMATAVLEFYRAAAQPALAEMGRHLAAAAARPGLAIIAGDDVMVGTEHQHRMSAQRAGARVDILAGHGHWWMTQGGGRTGAVALQRFWSEIAG